MSTLWSRPASRHTSRARWLSSATLSRRQAYMAVSLPARASSAQAWTIASSASSRLGAVRTRPCSTYQDTASPTWPARSWARAARSISLDWRTLSDSTCTA